ncbi:hypothetical protein ACOSP7_017455 [Xanthoceras sorbifolium]
MRPMLLIPTKSNIFSEDLESAYLQDSEDGDSHKRVCSKDLLAGQNGVLSVSYMSKETQTCTKVPAKETTSVTLTKNSNGKKMINEYVKERKISRGSYGKVTLYRNSNDGTPYAIKTVCKSRLCKLRMTRSESAMANVYREVSILKRLDHPNIVKLFEVIDDQKADHLYIVLEYVEGNSIGNISRTPGQIFDEETARSYFKDIIAGVIYLHSHNIVHGDIKPENLLLTTNGRVKIGDFSFSQAFEDDNDELRRCPGTPAFTPPECYLGTLYHGKAADTWAIGVTLYYIVVGCYPFIADNIPETYDKIVNSPLSLPEELDPQLKDLLLGLLCKDPMQRITLDVAAEHPWVIRERVIRELEPEAYNIGDNYLCKYL